MKHLKMFEGFSKEDYYTRLPDGNFEVVLVKFNPKESSIISDKLKEFDVDVKEDSRTFHVVGDYIRRKHRYIYLRIDKSEDDWFYIHKGHIHPSGSIDTTEDFEYYKCDQLEGLLKCIEDNIN